MKYLNNYKGKWHILSDTDDEMYGSVGTIEDDAITEVYLLEHVKACQYYGIPPYIGSDEKLEARIEEIYNRLSKEIV